MKRRKSRETALQSLFQFDLNPTTDPAWIAEFVRRRLDFVELEQLALSIVSEARAKQSVIDAIIAKAADNWSVQRMSAVDRNVLRMAVCEIKYLGTPPMVAIDEAVELAKRFSGHESSSFVNGILDRVVRESVENDEPESP